jgi:activator of HSP90 ATPase
MPKTLTQKVLFKGANANQLYSLYMDAKKHALATGAPAKITAKEGATYKVHDGYIAGKNLKLVKGKMIVQTWRAQTWAKNEIDSVLILTFEENTSGASLTMIHSNVPDKYAASIKSGWNEHYWSRWKQYLAKK